MVSEYNVVYKKLRRGILRIAHVYPSIYEASISSLATHMIYFLGNSYPEVYVERFAADINRGVRSIETGSPLRDFDIVLFSIHYEPDYATMARILSDAGIPVLRSQRGEEHPVVLVGGPAPMANPEPIIDIVDAVLIGEIEPLLPRVIEKWFSSSTRRDYLDTLMGDGVYRGLGERVRRVYAKSLDDAFYPVRQVQSVDREPVYGRGVIIESSRGCRYICRFCMETRVMQPYRPRGFSVLKRILDDGIEVNRVRRAIIYSLYFPGSPGEKKLLEYMVENHIEGSVPSIRLDLVDDWLMETVRLLGQRTIAVAPENMCRWAIGVYAKYRESLVRDTGVYATVFRHGLNLKLYLIDGVRGEPMECVRENIGYVRRIASLARRHGARLRVSINPLIPKPWTPFQWIGMVEAGRAKAIISMYRRELGGVVESRPIYVPWAQVQAEIALGHRWLGKAVIEWGLAGGRPSQWRRVTRRLGIDTGYAYRGWGFGDELPWSRVELMPGFERYVEQEYLIIRGLIDGDG